MNIIQISNWQHYRKDGEQFLRTAQNAHILKKEAFTPETLYNLVCMGIEKLIMAYLMKHGDLAENHTMTDLARALQKHLELDTTISEQLEYLDTFHDLCSLESGGTKTVSKSDANQIIAIGSDLYSYLQPHLN